MGSVVDILDGHGHRSRVTAEPQTESVSELIHRCNDAVSKMGNGNPNKQLVFDCARTMKMLCDRLYALEGEGPGVILDTYSSKLVKVPDGQ